MTVQRQLTNTAVPCRECSAQPSAGCDGLAKDQFHRTRIIDANMHRLRVLHDRTQGLLDGLKERIGTFAYLELARRLDQTEHRSALIHLQEHVLLDSVPITPAEEDEMEQLAAEMAIDFERGLFRVDDSATRKPGGTAL